MTAHAARATAKTAAATAKAAAKGVSATVKAMIASVKALVAAIAAGGWVARLIPGMGLFAQALKQQGYKVIDVEEIVQRLDNTRS